MERGRPIQHDQRNGPNPNPWGACQRATTTPTHSFTTNVQYTRGHTPALAHSPGQHHHVTTEPEPSSCSRYSRAISCAARSGCPGTPAPGYRFSPKCRTRRSTLGSNSSTNAESLSSTSQGFGRAAPHHRINSPEETQPPRDQFGKGSKGSQIDNLRATSVLNGTPSPKSHKLILCRDFESVHALTGGNGCFSRQADSAHGADTG